MGRLFLVVILLIVSIVVGHSLKQNFEKAYDAQKKEIALIENL